MPLKPLESPKKTIYIKIGFLILLILLGVFIFRYAWLKKAATEDTLGAETSLKDGKASVSLEEIQAQGEDLVNQLSTNAKQQVGSVLGTFDDLVSDQASKSADTVKEYIIVNTVGGLLQQIDKLPEADQELIKKEICR